MNRSLSIVLGLMLGAAVGVGLGILFAPQSGAEMQQRIRERVDGVLAEGRQAAETRRLELTEQFEALKRTQPPREAAGS